jgi:hypothetical protein
MDKTLIFGLFEIVRVLVAYRFETIRLSAASRYPEKIFLIF